MTVFLSSEDTMQVPRVFPPPSKTAPGLQFSRWLDFGSPYLSCTGFFGSSLISTQRGCWALCEFLLPDSIASRQKARAIIRLISFISLLGHHNRAPPPVVQCLKKSYFMYFVQLSNCLLCMAMSSPCYHSMVRIGSPQTYIFFYTFCNFESYFWAFLETCPI